MELQNKIMATKFLEIEVFRPVTSVLYVEVDESFDIHKDVRKLNLDKIAQQTTDKRHDWTDDGISDVEMQRVKIVSASEASHYDYYDFVNDKPSRWQERRKKSDVPVSQMEEIRDPNATVLGSSPNGNTNISRTGGGMGDL